MYFIKGWANNNRISSRELQLEIWKAIQEGEKEIEIDCYGQHNIGLLPKLTKNVTLHIKNCIGQRLGAMSNKHINIIAYESASDDVGFLNIGADITILGDTSNATGSAMAQGRIFINGSTGARALAMAKHNPAYKKPELWVLGSVGDYSFEFNCGAIAVVCNIKPMNKLILGKNPCKGMVGGKIFFRGEIDTNLLDQNIKQKKLNNEDWTWLLDNLPIFIYQIKRKDLFDILSIREEWNLLEPK